ncbi:hypothetical protein HDV05_001202 [Chytridiales sp. JEL 0842]|nr:hypothetical protein HDV05_001202 [Chytridiales sp. JEL 0842]
MQPINFSTLTLLLATSASMVSANLVVMTQTISAAIPQGETCWNVYNKDAGSPYWTDPSFYSIGKGCVTGGMQQVWYNGCAAGRGFNAYVGPSGIGFLGASTVDVTVNGASAKGSRTCLSLEGFPQYLDDSPKETLMERLRKSASPTKADPSDMLAAWLPFAFKPEYRERVAALTNLIETFKQHPAATHTTKALEFEGMETEEETEHVIRRKFATNNEKEKLVLKTLELLKTTYTPTTLDSPRPQDAITFDAEKIRLFHRVLLDGVVPDAGLFRATGASSKLPNGEVF